MDKIVLDVDEFMERVQDDKDLLVELLDIFAEDFSLKRAVIDEAVSLEDFELIKSVAHSLKGASGNISAKSLREYIIKIEEMGKLKDVTQAPEILAGLDKAYELFLQNVKELKEKFGA